MTDFLKKTSLSEFTKKEFLDFVTDIGDEETEEEGNINVRHFDMLVPHPEKSDLLFWPPEGIENSEDIVEEVEKFCKENKLPCFKK